ncbi:Protein disulfide-isomerase [Diplonema papillatum]|nr:Protein disulfide-isomerase [Diplonema papillatum]
MHMLAVVLASAAALAAAADVVTADTATLPSFLGKGIVVVKFHTPWCALCKRVAPEYESAAGRLKETATLLKVDASVETDLAKQYGLHAPGTTYPAIKVFFDGDDPVDYDGDFRKADDMVSWVQARKGPLMHPLDTATMLEELKGQHRLLVVGHFPSAESEDALAFKQFAKTKRGHNTFAVSYDTALGESLGVASPSVVLHKQFDHGKDVLSSPLTPDSLAEFLRTHAFPVLDEIGMHNFEAYASRNLPMGYLLLNPADTLATTAAQEAVKAVALNHVGTISFVWVNALKMPQVATNVGLRKGIWPSFAIDHEGSHYAFPEGKPVEKEAVAQFVADYMDGKLEPTIKSEDEPEKLTENGLTTLVGFTFKSVVFDADKDVFVQFYAPYCGHCKKMIPAYQQVADTFRDNDGVLVAKMDAIANDVPAEFPILGFPQMYFVQAGTNELQSHRAHASTPGSLAM